MSAVVFTIGDLWSYVATASFTDPAGVPVVPTGWGIESKLVDSNNRVTTTFTTTWIDINSGTFSHIAQTSQTRNWKEGKYTFNIKFISPAGDPISSAPVQVIVTLGNKI